jgi:uncharacterized membrane protein
MAWPDRTGPNRPLAGAGGAATIEASEADREGGDAMDLYKVLLLAHILGAIVLVGGTMAQVPLLSALKRADTVAAVRERAAFLFHIGKASGPAAGIVFIAGVGMTIMEWSFVDGWILVALVIFVLMGGLAGLVLDPHAKRVVEAAGAAPDGPVPADLADLIHERRANVAHAFFLPLDVTIVALMVLKPALAGSLSLAGVAFVLGAAAALREQRGVAPAPAA